MGYKSKRSKATDISSEVKKIVYERDNGRCIYCGRAGIPNAHYISRAKGGLGIPENIVTLCLNCHENYDNGNLRREIGNYIARYLKGIYGDSWSKGKLVFHKWNDFKKQ